MNANESVENKPEGYRWANQTEVARRDHPAYWNKMVRVQRNGGYLRFAIKAS